MTHATILTDRFDRALLYATHVHGGQARKGTTTPYVAHLLADKVHNARAILRDLRKPEIGATIWDRFSQPKDQTLWYYRSLAERFRARLPGQLAEELGEIVGVLEKE